MSDEQKTEKNDKKKKAASEDPTAAAVASELEMNEGAALLDSLLAGKGAQELRLERTIYQAEVCGHKALVGFMIALLDMPPIEMGRNQQPRAWQAFHFVLTHPSKGVDREDNVVNVVKDDEIIIPATYQLHQNLRRFAFDRQIMHEIGLVPKKKIDIGGGKNFWTYRIITTGRTRERGAMYSFEAAYGLDMGVKQSLPQPAAGAVAAALPPNNGLYSVQSGQPVSSVVGGS